MADTADGITMLVCDVIDDQSVQSVVDEVLKRTGRIDLLVNNAGIGLLGGAEESTTAQAKAVFDVNVFGTMRMTNAVLPVMRRQRSGRIINLSSILGLIPAPFNALYAATKHAIEGYSGPSTMKCAHRASASCSSNRASPALPSRRTSRGRTGRLPSMMRCAPTRRS